MKLMSWQEIRAQYPEIENPTIEQVAERLYAALHGIFVEELNGRLCALPDTLPGFGDGDESVPREMKCCPACAQHWARTYQAMQAYEKFVAPTQQPA